MFLAMICTNDGRDVGRKSMSSCGTVSTSSLLPPGAFGAVLINCTTQRMKPRISINFYNKNKITNDF